PAAGLRVAPVQQASLDALGKHMQLTLARSDRHRACGQRPAERLGTTEALARGVPRVIQSAVAASGEYVETLRAPRCRERHSGKSATEVLGSAEALTPRVPPVLKPPRCGTAEQVKALRRPAHHRATTERERIVVTDTRSQPGREM